MRKLRLMSIILFPVLLGAETPTFFSNVTNLWFQGHKSNVLALAQERLSCNSNDIAGLILSMEYNLEFEFDDLNGVSNSIQKVINRLDTISTPLCATNGPHFRMLLEDMRNLVMDSAMYDDVANDKAKANFPGKKLLFEEVLLNICLDGLVTNSPPNPQ